MPEETTTDSPNPSPKAVASSGTTRGLPRATEGFDQAVRKFKTRLRDTQGGNSSTALPEQYLNGALDNMEAGRQAVQEKVKFAVPTVIGTLAASVAIAAFAIKKPDRPGVSGICFALAGLTSLISIFVSRLLMTVMEATFEFYVAAVIHAAIVFRAVNLQHPWCDLVHKYARLANRDAQEIWKTWRDKVLGCKWIGRLLIRPSHCYFGDQAETQFWSRRVLEQWKAGRGNLLWSYNRILSWGIAGHTCLFAIFVFCFFWEATGDDNISKFIREFLERIHLIVDFIENHRLRR